MTVLLLYPLPHDLEHCQQYSLLQFLIVTYIIILIDNLNSIHDYVLCKMIILLTFDHLPIVQSRGHAIRLHFREVFGCLFFLFLLHSDESTTETLLCPLRLLVIHCTFLFLYCSTPQVLVQVDQEFAFHLKM